MYISNERETTALILVMGKTHDIVYLLRFQNIVFYKT